MLGWPWQIPPLSLTAKCALVLIALEAVCVIGLESYIATLFYGTQDNTVYRNIPVYLLLFVTAQIFENVLLIDAVMSKNVIELVAFCVFHWCAFAYSLFQYFQLRDPLQNSANLNLWQKTQPLLIAIPCVVALCGSILSAMVYKLYREFGWDIYKRIGADPRIKRNVLTLFRIHFLLNRIDRRPVQVSSFLHDAH